MKKKIPKPFKQKALFQEHEEQENSKFISVYRVSLVRDEHVAFEKNPLNNSAQATRIIQKLIETQGQSDREQFCIIMLNAKNVMIGVNIVSTGSLTAATVYPREVLKPAILANACAMILCHNHPSHDLTPSEPDISLTKQIVQASKIMGIQIHEHLIVSLEDDRYYSFADNGIIRNIYDEID